MLRQNTYSTWALQLRNPIGRHGSRMARVLVLRLRPAADVTPEWVSQHPRANRTLDHHRGAGRAEPAWSGSCATVSATLGESFSVPPVTHARPSPAETGSSLPNPFECSSAGVDGGAVVAERVFRMPLQHCRALLSPGPVVRGTRRLPATSRTTSGPTSAGNEALVVVTTPRVEDPARTA
jgi:hypothetical protein